MKTCTKCGSTKPLTEFYKKLKSVTARCKPCVDADNKAWANAHREKTRVAQRAWGKANPAKVKASQQNWNRAHPENIAAAQRRWAKAHPGRAARRREADPENYSAWAKAWIKAHPEKHAARVARRRAGQLQATPAWANQFFIAEAYALAKLRTDLTGIKWHVDHLVPLVSKKVCGLHTEFNLSVVPSAQNISKGNRFWPDMAKELHG